MALRCLGFLFRRRLVGLLFLRLLNDPLDFFIPIKQLFILKQAHLRAVPLMRLPARHSQRPLLLRWFSLAFIRLSGAPLGWFSLVFIRLSALPLVMHRGC